jgi:hypothetical protein
MKFVVIGEPSGASMEAIMAVYPRHKTLVDEFIARGLSLASDRFQIAEIWPSSRQTPALNPSTAPITKDTFFVSEYSLHITPLTNGPVRYGLGC